MNNNGPFLLFNAIVLAAVLGVGVTYGVSPKESIAHVPKYKFKYEDTQKLTLKKEVSREQYNEIERFLLVTPRGNYHLEKTAWRQQDGDIRISNKSQCNNSLDCSIQVEITQLSEIDQGEYRIDAYGSIESVKSQTPIASQSYTVMNQE